jgi:hypothetical protein
MGYYLILELEQTLNNIDEHYTAENDVVDSLRLESSIATPEQRRLLHDAAVSVRESVIQGYGSYIQPEALGRTEYVEDRIIPMGKEHFEAFYAEWDGSGDALHGTIPATTYERGDIIALNDPGERWHTVWCRRVAKAHPVVRRRRYSEVYGQELLNLCAESRSGTEHHGFTRG